MQSRARPALPSPGAAASPKRLKVTNIQFANEAVWAQNPESQTTEVYPPHN